MALRKTIKLYTGRGHVRTVEPTIEPVSAADLRAQLVMDQALMSNREAGNLIREAREMIEDISSVAMTTQTWLLALDGWPAYREQWWSGMRQGAISDLDADPHLLDLLLPRFPLQSISGINVYDTAGNATAVTVASVFDVDTYHRPGRIALKFGQTWPVATRPTNAVEITYVAGYGDDQPDVPQSLRRAVLQLAAGLYSNRGDCDAKSIINKSGAGELLNLYKKARI